jgi:hypothetical protein
VYSDLINLDYRNRKSWAICANLVRPNFTAYMGGECSAHRGKCEMCTTFWLECLKGRDYSEDRGVNVRIILKWILGKYGVRMWTELIWLRIKTDGGLL